MKNGGNSQRRKCNKLTSRGTLAGAFFIFIPYRCYFYSIMKKTLLLTCILISFLAKAQDETVKKLKSESDKKRSQRHYQQNMEKGRLIQPESFAGIVK